LRYQRLWPTLGATAIAAEAYVMHAYFLFLLVGALVLSDPAGAQDSVKFAEQTVPFELKSDFLVIVNGEIGELHDLKFILDTGATYTVIDRRVADKLQLHREPGKVMNFDREVALEWAQIPPLRVGPIVVKASRALVGKLSDYSSFAEEVDGIIGLDVLGKSEALMIDYQKRAISWQVVEKDGNQRSRENWNYYVVPIVVQGRPLRLVVDTGLEGIVLFADRLRKDMPHLRTEGEEVRVDIGRLQATQVKLPGVRIAGSETVATVFLMNGPDVRALSGVDGYLGVASLHAKQVEFDFRAMQIRWR
jgi:predicted aspartyl protease